MMLCESPKTHARPWARRRAALVAGVAILTMHAAPALAIGPSFDCDKVATPLGRLICADAALSRIDLEFGQAYYALRQQVGPAGWQSLKVEDIDFVNSVTPACGLTASAQVGVDQSAALACVAGLYQHQRSIWASRLNGAAADEAGRPVEQHLALQQQLKALGYLPASAVIDGVYGEATRGAIASWQQSNGFAQTGLLDDSQAARLAQTGATAAQEAPSGQADGGQSDAHRDAEAARFWNGVFKIGRGLAEEGMASAAAEATHKCSVKALVHAYIDTVNAGFVDAAIESLAGDQAGKDPSSHSGVQAIKLFVAGAMDDDGLRGFTKEAVIAAVQAKFPNNPFAVAYTINALEAHDKCEAERPQSGDTD
jgi:peptidoglycan hydrolase-like protein with peptidoglycan-binding domain